MTTTHNLTGKVAVMTGGSSGIGLAAAQRSVAADAYVFITGSRQDALEAAFAQADRKFKRGALGGQPRDGRHRTAGGSVPLRTMSGSADTLDWAKRNGGSTWRT